jgi:hypothetical protein
MQGLSAKYGRESRCVIPAVQIAERWNADARHVASDTPLQWNVQLSDEAVCVEAGLIRSLLKDALEMAIRISSRRSLQITCRCDGGRICFEIAAEDVQAGAGIVDSQQAYWTALAELAKRGQILMRPAILSPDGSFPIHVSLPIHQPVA